MMVQFGNTSFCLRGFPLFHARLSERTFSVLRKEPAQQQNAFNLLSVIRGIGPVKGPWGPAQYRTRKLDPLSLTLPPSSVTFHLFYTEYENVLSRVSFHLVCLTRTGSYYI